MLNLHALVAPAIALVNPPVPAQLFNNVGYDTSPAGHRAPVYGDPVTITPQVQALDGAELELVEGLGIAGVKRLVFVQAVLTAADRANRAGGDLIAFGEGPGVPPTLQNTTWLVTVILETWDNPGWSRACIVKQLGGAPNAGA